MENTSMLGRKTNEESVGLSSKNRYMVETALMIAVTLIMGNTILGTIPTPFLKVSIVTVPVALASMLIGPAAGIICGIVFGLNSFSGALTGASGMLSTLFTISPVGVFVTAVVARFLDAALVSVIYRLIHRGRLKTASYYITGALMPLFNTVFFMTSLCLFFYNTDYVQGLVQTYNAGNAFSFVIAMVGFQATVEAIIGCILGGTVAMVLAKVLHRA
ncbi:ECF transporter S component [Butyrivibrio sp. MC2013]|uniref:ECF transporter S component n=1 Tax=Butyrivibrio sp. MC2013 TaxID=1280686 RepID=UPI00040287FE|nr:ECF transporter S component [Butyrivibrio sp. MC2013]